MTVFKEIYNLVENYEAEFAEDDDCARFNWETMRIISKNQNSADA